jgi:methylated-DNA-[protein]-cysteine S-methyltransferase
MRQRTKTLPEKLYGSAVGWEGWTFQVLSSKHGLRRLEFAPIPFSELAARLKVRILPDDPSNEPVLQQLHEYLRGARRAFTLSLDLRGTPFQKAVWAAVARIPYGATTTYGALANEIGHPKASRAVGQAVGANPVPIVIPCHRVIGKDGHLVGFGGGLPLKERLLMLEKGSLNL